MPFRLKPGSIRLLEPSALFFIIVIFGQIVARIVTGGHVVTPATIPLLMGFWAFGAAAALVYSVVVLRYMLKAGLGDRVLYVISALIYFVLIFATPLVKYFGPKHS